MFKRIIILIVMAFLVSAGVATAGAAHAGDGKGTSSTYMTVKAHAKVPASCTYKEIVAGYSSYEDEVPWEHLALTNDRFRVSHCVRMNGRLKIYKSVGNTASERTVLKGLARGSIGTGYNKVLCVNGDKTVLIDQLSSYVASMTTNTFHSNNWNKWTKRYVQRHPGCYTVK